MHQPPLPQEVFLLLICYRLSQPQGHSEAGRIMSTKNSNDTIRNRTRNLLVCSAVPQPLRHCMPLIKMVRNLVNILNMSEILLHLTCYVTQVANSVIFLYIHCSMIHVS